MRAPRRMFLQPLRPEDARRQGDQPERQCAQVGVGDRVGPCSQRCERSALSDARAEERQHLDHDDDHAHRGGESRHHRIRRVGHVAAQPQSPHQHLDQPGQRNNGQRLGEIFVDVVEVDHRHRHRQRGGGPGDLGLAAAEERGEHADDDGSVEALNRSESRRLPEGQRQWKSHHGRGQPTEDVTLKGLELVADLQAHDLGDIRPRHGPWAGLAAMSGDVSSRHM